MFDGGDGFDTVELLGFRPGALTTAVYEAGVFTFGLTRGAADWTIQLTNWESFVFRNGQIGLRQPSSLSVWLRSPCPQAASFCCPAWAFSPVSRRRAKA